MLSSPYLKTSYLRHVWRPGRKRITSRHRTRYFRSVCSKSLLSILITVCLILTTFPGRFWIFKINAMSPSVTMAILDQFFLLQTLKIISAVICLMKRRHGPWQIASIINILQKKMTRPLKTLLQKTMALCHVNVMKW